MNKTKKIVAAAVSFVMAGTLAGSLAACNKNTVPHDDTIKTIEYASGTTLNVALGYNSATTKISFDSATLPLLKADGSEASSSITLPDGTTYQKGALKPIWNSYQSALDIKVNDVWDSSASDTLTACVTAGLSNYDLIGAGSLNTIQTAIDGDQLLNLADYLDYMPNLRHFLESNALAELGTLSDVESGAIYYSPYYAGMNDAERYNLFRKDYVSELLDYATDFSKNGGTITFAAQAKAKKDNNLGNRQSNETYVGTSASIESYMGTTGYYTVKTTDPADTLKTVYVKVDYDAALTAAKDASTTLGAAINTAAGKTYDGTSGNIVDLQNFVINATSGEVKGEHLLKILREYIKVAYKWADTETAAATSTDAFYGSTVHGVTTKLSDIINSTYAAWDVDIYAAIGRCFVTCGNVLGKYQAQTSEYTNYGASTWLFVPRTGYTNRTTRLTAMIGELYGVRGMEGSGYVDSSGNLREHRFNVSTWDALIKFSAFHTEGLVPSFNTTDAGDETGSFGSSSSNSGYDGVNSHFQGLSSNDFVHTQTTGTAQATAGDYIQTTDGYTWTAVVTPVSRWLTTDTSTVSSLGVLTTDDKPLNERDSSKTTVTRFTESALKLKTGGLVIPKAIESDTNRLGATLALMDYIYSNDGQIVTTFGDRSDTDQLSGSDSAGYTTTNNGWWYGEEVTSLVIDGKETNISGKSMEELYNLGVVTTYDNGKQYTITEAYQGYALVYKNKLYRTGTDGANTDYPNGYVYNGVMTPYYTRAVRKLILDGQVVNNFKYNGVMSNTNLQNLLLGAESHGILNNAAMVQLCNDMSIKGFDTFSAALGNGSIQTVQQAIGDNPWYTCAPSITLPATSSAITTSYSDFTDLFKTSSSITNYLILEVGWYGTNSNLTDWNQIGNKNCDFSSAQGIATYLKTIAPQYENLRNAAWSELYDYYVNK